VTVSVLLPAKLKATGLGFVSFGAALGVPPGVTVNTQVAFGAMEAQLAGSTVVPAGKAGDAVYATFVAAIAPLLTTTIFLGVPVSAGLVVWSFGQRQGRDLDG